jgi:hypothetical protein
MPSTRGNDNLPRKRLARGAVTLSEKRKRSIGKDFKKRGVKGRLKAANFSRAFDLIDAMLQRQLDRMIPDDFGKGESEFAEQ